MRINTHPQCTHSDQYLIGFTCRKHCISPYYVFRDMAPCNLAGTLTHTTTQQYLLQPQTREPQTLPQVQFIVSIRRQHPSYNCRLSLVFIFHLRLQARALAKFDVFKDEDSGFPFTLLERSYFILFNLC
jgi:hypothetical protein